MSLYEEIYEVVRSIPCGKVATYGQIAAIIGRCSSRQVGYAMASVSAGSGIPWHRVINSRGKISVRSYGEPSFSQKELLESENVVFDENDRVDLSIYGWEPTEIEL
ncbi:methylated-DNA--[protein]-cysteine S-methyltransferase [bacterium]|nr:methylated-DNA--[protein]-cysteine S-methyltransferase [candidate division CSSED10-310 bacterium]